MKLLRPLVFALSFGLAINPEAALCGWGVDVGRASDADVNDLVHAEQALWSAKRQLTNALTKELEKERELKLLGLPSETSVADLLVQTTQWWLQNIMKPAAEIAVNPAASCAEAQLEGQDIRRELLQDRRKRLERLLRQPKGKAAQTVASGIVLSEAIVGKGEAMFQEACRMGLEGIVSKRLDSPYVSGRTRAWLKTKKP